MTLASQTILAERLSRTSGANTITQTSDATKQYLNEGVREFAKRCHGLATETFIQLSPKFDAGTDFAIRFSIGGAANNFGSADIPMVSSAINDATPTTFMGHLVSNVNATIGSITISMGWSPSTWTFQLYGPASVTSIAITAPTGTGYTDGAPAMFGGYKTATTTITGSVPQDANLETSLPTGFLEMDYAYYGSWQLQPAPFNIFLRPRQNGTPTYYAVKNKILFLDPTPNRQDFLKLYYTGMPPDLGVDGTSDTVACPLPEEVHMAPVYWAAACLLEEGHEFEKAVYYQQKFANIANDYKMREANNSPAIRPSRREYIPPRIVI